MWISEFAQRAGVSVDTVRFYVRKGLLAPALTGAGATHRYQSFAERDLRRMEAIRVGQALGMSLQDIKALVDLPRKGSPTASPALEGLRDVRDKLRVRSEELAAMQAFVAAKIAWLERGQGPRPNFSDYVAACVPTPAAAHAATTAPGPRDPGGPGPAPTRS